MKTIKTIALCIVVLSAISCSKDDEKVDVLPAKVTELFSDAEIIAYYPFNGNSNDESVNSNNAESTNAILTEDRFGEADEAYKIEEIVNSTPANNIVLPSLNLGNEFSICAWVKSNAIDDTQYQCIISKTSETRDFVFRINNKRNGRALNWHATQGSNHVTNSKSFTNNKWVHVAFVYDNGKVSLYESGKKVASKSLTPIVWSGNKIIIGSLQQRGNEYFNGVIDDVLFINRTINSDEIARLAADN